MGRELQDLRSRSRSKLYLPNEADRTEWDKITKVCAGRGIPKSSKRLDWSMRDEGVLYGEKLRKFGKKAGVVVYPNATHAILAMDGKRTLTLC